MKLEDFIGPPCPCAECRQAGVSELPQRRDPQSGAWMHGYALKRFYRAQQGFAVELQAMAAKWSGEKTMPGGREPGSDD